MWYYNVDDSGIIISSRVRFARNLEKYKFPNILNNTEKQKVVNDISNVLKSSKNNLKLIKLKDMDNITLNSLVERHIISKEYIYDLENGNIILNDECTLSVMINEEDHLRIQGFAEGFNIQKAYSIAKNLENSIGEKINYAVSEEYGYLTACPTNLGSAFRCSVMLHLPALSELKYIPRLLEEASVLGITIRGMYGENTAAKGYIYQISNQNTLGVNDEEIMDKIKSVVKNIVKQEEKARQILQKSDDSFEDKIYRSFGILKYARKIDTKEAEELLSNIRLGTSIGILKDIDNDVVQKLSVDIYPNMLQTKLKETLSSNERDVKRAEYIRKELN